MRCETPASSYGGRRSDRTHIDRPLGELTFYFTPSATLDPSRLGEVNFVPHQFDLSDSRSTCNNYLEKHFGKVNQLQSYESDAVSPE